MDVPSDLDWTAPLAQRGAVPGLTRPLTIIYTVPKTSEGDLRFVTTFEAPDAAEGGGSADGAEPDEVELTAVPAVAEALRSGAITPNVAWMSGRLKAAGPTGPLLAVLALADSLA